MKLRVTAGFYAGGSLGIPYHAADPIDAIKQFFTETNYSFTTLKSITVDKDDDYQPIDPEG